MTRYTITIEARDDKPVAVGLRLACLIRCILPGLGFRLVSMTEVEATATRQIRQLKKADSRNPTH